MKIGIIILLLVVIGAAIVYAYRRSSKRRAFYQFYQTYQPDYKKRDCSLPPGCKDLIDVIRSHPQATPTPLPPITQRITLPEVVAVSYLAELLQLSKENVSALCGYFGERSVPFDLAQEILRKYGILADKAG
jgi:hypothetical protein